MALRTKTLLILGFTLLTLLCVIAITSEIIVEGGFARVEDLAAQKDTHRALVALVDDINTLDSVAVDWAARDLPLSAGSGSAGDGGSPALDDGTFERLAFNYIVLSDGSGKILRGRGYDLESHTTIPIPESLTNVVSPDAQLRNTDLRWNGTMGIVTGTRYPLLVAVRPVAASQNQAGPKGFIILARHLDNREVERLSNMTQLALQIREFNHALPSDTIDTVLAGLSSPEGRFLERTGTDAFEINATTLRWIKDSDTITGFALIRDVYGQPALILSVDIPRDISKQGTSTMIYFLTILLLTGIIIGSVMVFLLERTILSRLLSLSSHASSIGAKRDFSARVEVEGDDEITALAADVNSMLSELEKSQLGLKVRLDQSEENYRLFFNSIVDMVVVIRPGREGYLSGTVIEANDSAIANLKISREDLVMNHFSDIVHPDDHTRIGTFLLNIRSSAGSQIEGMYWTRSGKGIPVEMNIRVFDQFGQEAMLVIARDITERRAIEELKREAFQQIEKNMQQFAILNDHIRNPLQGIIGTADLIDDENTEKIIRHARVINDIVDKLDRGYLESEKIQEFLRKYYGIDRK